MLFPGGFGTHDEGFEALTLMQTGKSQVKPLVFIDRPGGNYWKTWWRFVEDQLLGSCLISKEDLALFRVTDDIAEACREITGFYRNYHSSRFVREGMILRVQRPVTEVLLNTLNERFGDLCLNSGQFVAAEAVPEEEAAPELAGLHRISFPFNRKNYGLLRRVIDVLNQH